MPHLRDQGDAVPEQQREDRPDDGGLAGAHDHLVAERLTVAGGPHEPADQPDLLLTEDLALNMFCQYIYLWVYAIPAADL